MRAELPRLNLTTQAQSPDFIRPRIEEGSHAPVDNNAHNLRVGL